MQREERGDACLARARSIARLGALAAAVGALTLVFLRTRGERTVAAEDTLLKESPPRGPRAAPMTRADRTKGRGAPASEGAPRDPPSPSGDPANPHEMPSREILERRLARAEATLNGYLAGTRYPPTSRPMSEQPDQGDPRAAPPQKLPLARADKKLTDAHVILRQDRFFMAGDEHVTFSIACETSEGPAACEVLSSLARSAPRAPATIPSAPQAPARSAFVSFTAREDPSSLAAVFCPAKEGFDGYYGPIRVDIELRVDGESGGAGFDVEYTPSPPAAFTGSIREVIEGGSLSLYVGLSIEKAGRYVLQARVDDASGRSFALLSFNDELPAGRAFAKLVVFGKLVLDEGAAAPFRLRDLEGFRLLEDTYPDRELLESKDGLVYTTKPYTRGDFEDSEWQSEEKERHLVELRGAVEGAKKALETSTKP